MPAVLLHVVTVETRVTEIGKRFEATLRQITLPNVTDLSLSWMKASAFHAKQHCEGRRTVCIFGTIPRGAYFQTAFLGAPVMMACTNI